MSDLIWLSKAQMRRIEPYFPRSHGVPRVDDRRVVSGIIFVIRNGQRWRDAPREYARKQPRGKLPPRHSTTRTEAAEVQVLEFSPEGPRQPRRRLQHLQHPADLVSRPGLRTLRTRAHEAWTVATAAA